MQYYLLDLQSKIIDSYDFSILSDAKPFKKKVKLVLPNTNENVIQVAVITDRLIKDCRITTTVLSSEYNTLDNAITVFNTQGYDHLGQPFNKNLDLSPKELNILYIGLNLEEAEKDTYKGKIIIDGFYSFELNIEVKADATPTSYKNLHYLNSRRNINANTVSGYKGIEIDKNNIKLMGKIVEIGENGLIANVQSFLNQSNQVENEVKAELFAQPMNLYLGDNILKYRKDKITTDGYKAIIRTRGKNENIAVDINGEIFYDGFYKYVIKISGLEDTIIDNVSLNAYFKSCKYNMGLGKVGGYYENIDYKWNNENNWDSLFIGDTNVGLKIKFLDLDYQKPNTNVYYRQRKNFIPKIWNNGSKGGIKVSKIGNVATLSAYIGSYVLVKDESILLIFEGNITPSKALDLKRHFSKKIMHPSDLRNLKNKLSEAIDKKFTEFNVHCGSEYNPFINAPYYSQDKLKEFIKKAKGKKIKVNLYYSLRDFSTSIPEYNAFNNISSEIIERKNYYDNNKDKNDVIISRANKIYGGEFNKKIDNAIVARPNSRLNNYYIETLNNLVNFVGLDGIFVDDTNADRLTMERAKKTLNENGNIELHTYNHLEERCGNVSSLLLYSEILPFVDSLWMGEGYDIKTAKEDFILAEMSGLLFGKNAMTMQNDNDYNLSMLYGMYDKYGWNGDNAKIEAMFDLIKDQKLAESKFYGYWDEENPISCDNPNVKISCYIKEDKSIFVDVYNFSKNNEDYDIGINVKKLGFETHEKKKRTLKIKHLQSGKKLDFDKKQSVKAKSGYFLEIKK